MVAMRCQTLLVVCCAVLSAADRRSNDLTKLLSLSRASNTDGSAIVNVTSASIVIPSYSGPYGARAARSPDFQKYAFRPRSMPAQKEKAVYYTKDNSKYKSEILFPGNYYAIAKEKSNEDGKPGRFEPQAIPLSQAFEGRALDAAEDEIEKPEEFTEESASRRSLSYIFGGGEDEEAENEEEYESGDEELTEAELKSKNKRKGSKLKGKRYSKYMMPLLMAYKLKYFALVPVMIGGLVLLVGATGLAGFFFALFAATMGLQKGGY